MYKVKVIIEEIASQFEKQVQRLLDDDYEILSTNCGIFNHPAGYSDCIYQAILTKRDCEYMESEEL